MILLFHSQFTGSILTLNIFAALQAMKILELPPFWPPPIISGRSKELPSLRLCWRAEFLKQLGQGDLLHCNLDDFIALKLPAHQCRPSFLYVVSRIITTASNFPDPLRSVLALGFRAQHGSRPGLAQPALPIRSGQPCPGVKATLHSHGAESCQDQGCCC